MNEKILYFLIGLLSLIFIILLVVIIYIALKKKKPKPPPPVDKGLKIVPFGKNTYTGKIPYKESDLNPTPYFTGWMRLGTGKYYKNCDENGLIDAILSTYNSIAPSFDIDIDRDTGDINAESSDSKNGGENMIFSDFVKKILTRAKEKNKIIWLYPNILNGELTPYYANYKKGKLSQLRDYITSRVDKTYIKGFVYDTEFWDDNDDRNNGETDCGDSSPSAHKGHMHCFWNNAGSYFDEMAKAWAKLEPTWEIYVNCYPDRGLILNEDFIKAINDNYNLGFQPQDYFRFPDKNTAITEYISKLSSKKGKLVWGVSGLNKDNEIYKKEDVDLMKKEGFYGIFIFGGILYMINNGLYSCDV